jgi:HicB family
MSAISLRLPRSLHDAARALADKEEVSLNQLITLALAEKVSALAAEDYLGARAKRGQRKKYRRVLSKVPDIEPDEADRL